MRAIWLSLLARRHLFAGVLAGLLVYPLLSAAWPATTRAIIAWDVGVVVYLALSSFLFLTEPVEAMPDHAKAQQEGEWTIFALTIGVVVISFVAVTHLFAGLKSISPAWRGAAVGLVAVTLLTSWLMAHVSFAYRYAHEFYTRQDGNDEVDGGLDFPDEKRPDYLDFFYFSLVLGMTFQVSDVQITSRKLRRVATVHGLLSFLFNTVILALTVNIAAGLL
ncbi:DUF1345 domain-containing protein [Rhodopila sp.]|jgi:uncharacterized membrane protein|uniref:DUF1345 domain-containing protein n=1 Tax=Rhodopila sp. TaxID=2480087 RepID=UPI002BF5B121|nr:DUF1345 domain-containing protein [Rhodopila sp.]HVZ06481.1 DUF1345 domain-containing protein [Rhodopila sp.]